MQRMFPKIISMTACNLLVWIAGAQLSGRLAAQATPSARSDDQVQIAKGREVVGQVCVACHTNILRMVQVHRQSPEQWKDTVYSMIGRGAQVMPDEVEAVTAFLATNAGGNGQPTNLAENAGRPARDDQQMPEGEGKAILQRTCQQCHDLATASTKLASEEWSAVIAKMMTYGAKLTPADQQKLIAYLNGLAK